MGEDLQRQALARDLARRLQLASHDELRVIDRVVMRLELGRDRYGALDLAKPRDWRRELGEELLDAVVYDTVDTLRAEDAAHAELQAAAAEELAELHHWQSADRPTVISGETSEIARTVTADSDPYETVVVDVADLGGEAG